MIAPSGKPVEAHRFGVLTAGVSAQAVEAGIMASRSGSVTAAPTPFKTVRRGRLFLVRNMRASPYLLAALLAGGFRIAGDIRGTLYRLRYAAHLELVGLYHRLDDGRKFVIFRG